MSGRSQSLKDTECRKMTDQCNINVRKLKLKYNRIQMIGIKHTLGGKSGDSLDGILGHKPAT